ncbi:DUF2612 domain-containing protein [Rhizobium bangladeshense]|uniref:DUF2612 domain-containing protein n=1 Tax=Rhizobium bangladeshense TaxID=1138189 RepID=UPI001C83DA8D|nr:DUF2612 domain-containing protein [Rhizobium bangladeshense]MBX4889761.1 DUF2612 domain-containing protein [Rhizobium bangladeshense]
MDCPDKATIVDERIDRILTQYRESPNLIGIIRRDLNELADIIVTSCSMPSEFDILSAVGDQLTLVGKRLGWPRCHCICVPVPVFGFECASPDPNQPIVGLCEDGVWAGCQEAGDGDICLDDDETYRRYLLARRYQARQLWDIDSLQAAARHVWGDAARVVSMGGGRVAIQPGRVLTSLEEIQLPVAFRVLPLAPGITPHLSSEVGEIFGFGSGWGGLCDGSTWLCPQEFNPYICA